MADRWVVDDRGVRWRVTQAAAAGESSLVFTSDAGSQLCWPAAERLERMTDSQLERALRDLRRWWITEMG